MPIRLPEDKLIQSRVQLPFSLVNIGTGGTRRHGLSTTRRSIPTAGLKLWLDASRISGLADGDPITTWSDLSGGGNDATQATAAAKPLYKVNIVNGRPVVRFDGTDDRLETGNFSLSQPVTIVIAVVFRAAPPPGDNPTVYDGLSVNKMRFFREQVAPTKMWMYSDGVSILITTTPESWHIYSCTWNAASSALVVDGGTPVTGTTGEGVPNGVSLGGGLGAAFGECDIPEVLVYNRALSAGERQSVERHFSSKYNIVVS